MSFGCYHHLPRATRQSYKFTSLVYKTPTQLVLFLWLLQSSICNSLVFSLQSAPWLSWLLMCSNIPAQTHGRGWHQHPVVVGMLVLMWRYQAAPPNHANVSLLLGHGVVLCIRWVELCWAWCSSGHLVSVCFFCLGVFVNLCWTCKNLTARSKSRLSLMQSWVATGVEMLLHT